ncbi:uncharacterized protein C8Q71DRAFT_722536 [Rhodofomes roseus]|uniref:N-acetyltransferase domain-containing protein n=1 Tax=Rhodofomes roseus TaxID=34475 RepID=A0ABQ8KJK5_9APHY|nr:uncharacterized protein C8Q71DRAFT_722536 [Rhodofomes roseus]KAH9838324.1 hypothetical protein C8Q71DRAFT_722536 [Rhodofomes roseus]
MRIADDTQPGGDWVKVELLGFVAWHKLRSEPSVVSLLLCHTSSIEVHPLGYMGIFRAARTADTAFADDPLYDYIEDRPYPKSSRRRCFTRLGWYAAKVHSASVLSVSNGDAFLTFQIPGQEVRPVERTLYRVSELLCRGLSQEQRAECKEKENSAIRATFGERVRDMFRVDGLATRPSQRHRGYGSALMAAANIHADELGMNAWLTTSNVRNKAFYEHFGFVTVREYLVGEDNPRWPRPPVVVRIQPPYRPASHSRDFELKSGFDVRMSVKKAIVEVVKARYEDIPRITQMVEDAYKHHPLRIYLKAIPDGATIPHNSFTWRLLMYWELSYFVHYHAVFTVNRGDAFVAIRYPAHRVYRRPMLSVTHGVLNAMKNPEQRKRFKELYDKTTPAVLAAFGDKFREMLQVIHLATASDHQGKGYGSALMSFANARADELGCASWLMSTDTAYTPFYEALGFVVVKEVLMGEDNPAWTDKPVAIQIMMREARSLAASYDQKSLRS